MYLSRFINLLFVTHRDIVAIGDTQGNIEIWKIPRQLL